MAEFEKGVWPMMLTSLSVGGNGPYALEAPEPVMQTVAVQQMPEKTAAVTSADQTSDHAAPETGETTQTEESEYNLYRLTVTAKDAAGALVESANGLITVRYDPSQLELTDRTVSGDYTAINDAEAGVVTFAYAGRTSIPKGKPVAELVFRIIGAEDSTITVNHRESGETAPDYTEQVLVPVPVDWLSVSTTLGGNIGLNFYARILHELINDGATRVQFTFEGKTVIVPIHRDQPLSITPTELGARYRLTCPLNAKNMADEVVAQVIARNSTVGRSLAMKVSTYCNFMIQNGNDPELAALMMAMLNYGAAAQVLFDYRTDDLANASLSEEDKVLADVDASEYASVITGSEEGIEISSATLMLETETSIRIYFRLTGEKSINEYTFYVDDRRVYPVEKDGKYYIAIKNIAAQDLDKTYTITVGGLTIQYSGLSYVNTVLNNPDIAGEALVNTVKALYAYNKAAESYFN